MIFRMAVGCDPQEERMLCEMEGTPKTASVLCVAGHDGANSEASLN